MSQELINQITLDCLLNKEQLNKNTDYKISKLISKKDKKFYRKRIFDLTRSLLLNKDKPKELSPDIKYAFDNYVKSCVSYFKTIDNNDIIQDEYKDLEDLDEIMNNQLENEIDLHDININSKEEADKLMLRSINLKPTLDSFIHKVKIKSEEIILPKQKEINLNDPNLKTKGIKKKNINNKYDENNKSKKAEIKEDKKNNEK